MLGEGKTYSFIIDGRDSTNVFGEKPVDDSRVNSAKKSFTLFNIAAAIMPIIIFFEMLLSEENGIPRAFITLIIGNILCGILYWVGKNDMELIKQKSIVRRCAMLKILEDNSLSAKTKNDRIKDCMSTYNFPQITSEDLKKMEATSYFEDEDSRSSRIDYNILEKQRLYFALSFIMDCAAGFLAFMTYFFRSW